MARAKKGEIREVLRDLKESIRVLEGHVSQDAGPAVVESLEQCEDELEAARALLEDRYASDFDEIEGPAVEIEGDADGVVEGEETG